MPRLAWIRTQLEKPAASNKAALTSIKKRGTQLAMVLISLLAGQASAFKIDTHVYISQQVINDIQDDGKVSVDIDGVAYTFPVEAGLVNAIRQHPAYFRMGSIGPDAFPGIIAGQVVIHPGDEDPTGWGTGDWLHYIESRATRPDEIAFAAGFKVHAASDAFAHTYVNHYAGDVWDLSDETHVELRHFILESFIASKNPPILNHQGVAQGSAAQAILDSSGKLAIPASFLADSLIFSPVSKRFEHGAPHLAFLGSHERNLADAIKKAEEIVVEIERLVLYRYTGIQANSSEIRRLRELANRLRKQLVPVDKMKDVVHEVSEIRKKHAEIPADVLEELLPRLTSAYNELAKARNKLDDAQLVVAGLHDQIAASINGCRATKRLASAHCAVTKEVEKLIGPLSKVVKKVTELDPTCMREANRLHEKALAACESISSVTALRPKLEAAIRLQNQLEQETLRQSDEVIALANEIESLMVTQIELENSLLQASLDMMKLSQEDINGVVAFLKGWREGVRRAGVTYVIANGEAMANAITPDKDPLDPLLRWLDCHTLPIAGVPHPLNDAACSVGDAKESVLASLKRITAILGKIDPLSKVVFELIEELENRIKQIVKEQVIAALQEVTGAPVKELMRIVKQPGTTEAVTRAFTTGEAYNLRSIPDAAYRVAADMGLSATSPNFDPNKFNAIYDAIALSKLSLLSAEQLNQLAAAAGVAAPTTYGPTLFGTDSPKASNILVGSVRSIDGSHQWFNRAMPYLRTWSHEHPPFGRFTYVRKSDPANGFRPWQDDGARDRLFRRVFRGPLVPGIDAPETIGFSPVLLASYPYRVCREHPWPSENAEATPDVMADTTCKRPSLAAQLAAYPDLTKENVNAMVGVHELLAPQNLDQAFLTKSEWVCASLARGSSDLHTWSFQFKPAGNVTGIVALRSKTAPATVMHQAAFSGRFKVVGDFLFTSPTGGAYIEPAKSTSKEPTLLRRFTSQPQKYWMNREGDAALALVNQDGTKLECLRAVP